MSPIFEILRRPAKLGGNYYHRERQRGSATQYSVSQQKGFKRANTLARFAQMRHSGWEWADQWSRSTSLPRQFGRQQGSACPYPYPEDVDHRALPPWAGSYKCAPSGRDCGGRWLFSAAALATPPQTGNIMETARIDRPRLMVPNSLGRFLEIRPVC